VGVCMHAHMQVRKSGRMQVHVEVSLEFCGLHVVTCRYGESRNELTCEGVEVGTNLRVRVWRVWERAYM